jgi:OOP family OmpA-OmpF porin
LGCGKDTAFLSKQNQLLQNQHLNNIQGNNIMRSFKLKFTKGLVLAALGLVACGSEPKVEELKITSDPQAEIERVNTNLKDAESKQVNVLSPNNFEEAQRALNKAIEGRSANKDQKAILHNIALSQAYLTKARSAAEVAGTLLKPSVEARRDALAANSPKFFSVDTENTDKSFKKLTREFEEGDTSGADKKGKSFEAQYRDLELKSIKADKLGPAQSAIQLAVKEGAKKLTPETLAWANKRYAEDEALIQAEPHNTQNVRQASIDAMASANRLVKMVRSAKGSSAQKPEDLAKQTEASENALVNSETDLAQAESDLRKSNANLEKSSRQNYRLETQVWLDKEFERASGQFTKDEAEVYKQGDSLLLRLKGLSFKKSNSGIGSENFPLLAKVQKVIGDIGPSQITVEGHTDSVGEKKLNDDLSVKRALAVQSYLVENKNILPEKISATGFGYAKPIATNKTAKGRAQNRRVDIIITAETAGVQ